MVETEQRVKRKVDSYSFEELVILFDKLWKLVIDKQIEENSPEWQKLVEKMDGDVDVARGFLYSRSQRVALCVDGNLEPFFEKAGITNPLLKKKINGLILPLQNPNAILLDSSEDIPIIWIPPHLLKKSTINFTLLHEMTHASDFFIQQEGQGTVTPDLDAKRYSRLYRINSLLGLSFLGIHITTLVPKFLEQTQNQGLTAALALSLIGTVVSGLRTSHLAEKYKHTPQESKANSTAKEILNQYV